MAEEIIQEEPTPEDIKRNNLKLRKIENTKKWRENNWEHYIKEQRKHNKKYRTTCETYNEKQRIIALQYYRDHKEEVLAKKKEYYQRKKILKMQETQNV